LLATFVSLVCFSFCHREQRGKERDKRKDLKEVIQSQCKAGTGRMVKCLAFGVVFWYMVLLDVLKLARFCYLAVFYA